MRHINIIESILKELERFPINDDIIFCHSKNGSIAYNIELMRLTIQKDQFSELLTGEQVNNPFVKELVKMSLKGGKKHIEFAVCELELFDILETIKNTK